MNKMYKILMVFAVILTTYTTQAQNVGIGTNTPNASAKLHIVDANRGILIPQVSIGNVTLPAPVATPATGLLVWNTNAATTGGNGQGFYFWNGTQWEQIASGAINDHDWYEVGTTNAPDNISDNIYTTNNVAINTLDPGTHQLMIGHATLPGMKIGHLGGYNNAESGRFVFDEYADAHLTPGVFCGFEFHHDGAANTLSLNGGCTAASNLVTFMRTGNVGISTTTPAERLEVVGNIRTSSLAGVGNRMVMSNVNGNLINLAAGLNTQVLTMVAGAPTWATASVLTGNGLSFGTAAPVLDEVILGGTLEQATTINQAAFPMNWTLNGTGDFFINNTLGSIFEANNVTELAINESSQNYDFRVESDTRTHALWIDASTDIVNFGSSASTATGNGSTIAGSVVQYVADFDLGGAIWDGTTIGIGSIEFLLDGVATTLINNSFGPTTHITEDLGTAALAWDDIYADDFWNVSDAREKNNIQDLSYGLKEVMAMRPVSYVLNKDKFKETKLGLLAQDALTIVPEAVKTHDHKILDETKPDQHTKIELDRMAVSYTALIPVLIKATQEQQELIEELQAEIKQLKAGK